MAEYYELTDEDLALGEELLRETERRSRLPPNPAHSRLHWQGKGRDIAKGSMVDNGGMTEEEAEEQVLYSYGPVEIYMDPDTWHLEAPKRPFAEHDQTEFYARLKATKEAALKAAKETAE